MSNPRYGKLKLFGRGKNKDNEEKPIIRYYAKYIGVLGSNKSLPVDEDSYVHIFEDRIDIELLKSKVKIIIPYKSMTELQHVDAGKKVDVDRVFAFGLPGLLWKRHAIVTVIKYNDNNSEPQTIALDFMANTKYAQPIINRKLREVNPKLFHSNTNQAVTSVSDEIGKLAKLKEQGIITEDEFSQMKKNLIEKK